MNNRKKEKDDLDILMEDIEYQYGQNVQDQNIRFALKLVADRVVDDRIDDDIPVPSVNAAAKTIILIVNRPELPWEKIAEEPSVRRTLEYLFVRAHNHHDEVHEFIKRLLYTHVKGLDGKIVLAFLNIWDYFCRQQRPSSFIDNIPHVQHSDRIISALHTLIGNETGKMAALIMTCAKEEGLIIDDSYTSIKEEFPQITKQGYNRYKNHYDFFKEEKDPVITSLRTIIKYRKEDDGRIIFLDDGSRKGFFLWIWRLFRSFIPQK